MDCTFPGCTRPAEAPYQRCARCRLAARLTVAAWRARRYVAKPLSETSQAVYMRGYRRGIRKRAGARCGS